MRSLKATSLAAILICTLLSVSFAGTTSIFDNKNPDSELDLHEILLKIAQDELGDTNLTLGTWSYTGEIVILNSSQNAVVRYFRVDDTDSDILDIKTGYSGVGDQFWKDGTTDISAEAKYAGHNHSLGWLDNTTSTPTASTIFSSTADAVTNGDVVTTGLSSNFEWYLYDQNSKQTWYSDASGNSDQSDHMVSFEMRKGDGTSAFKGTRTWVTAWEDLDDCHWDQDYNDFAALFSVNDGGITNIVPLPGAAWLGLVGLLGLAGLRRIRRRS